MSWMKDDGRLVDGETRSDTEKEEAMNSLLNNLILSKHKRLREAATQNHRSSELSQRIPRCSPQFASFSIYVGMDHYFPCNFHCD